ncbi:ABC transporter substrate-binding protein [Kitasatospora sp. NPDC089797]|uniref:ABC transporter substrate-binding protein n=1 Tax=Kitasatospora sp. NPDC089797 TaxID=3155298 RepID=UPI003445BE38
MKRHTHVLASAICATALTLTAGACSASDDALSGGPAAGPASGQDGPAVDGGTLRIGLDRAFTRLDPADSTLTSEPMLVLANALYDPLMTNGDDGTVQPYLAKEFTPNADATGWTLRLRDGVRFSDGKPLDAQAVIDHVTRLSKPESKCSCAADAAAIGSMAAPAADTVVFTLKAPNSVFPNAFTRSLGYVSEAPGADGTAIGSGPYVLAGAQSGVSAELTRNPAYWGAKGHADKLAFRVLPDTDSRYQSLRSGDTDLIWAESPAQFKQAPADGLRVAAGPGSTSTVLINTRTAPFDDPRVRQALQYAIDREAVEKVVGLGQGRAADGPIGTHSAYRAADPAPGYPAHDPARARQLLEEAGRPQIAFDYLVDSRPESQQRATVIQQMLGEAGIRMTVKPVDAAAQGTALMQHSFQVMDFITSMFGDTDAALTALYPSASPMNFTGYRNPAVDRSLAEGRAALDPGARAAAYHDAARQIVADAPMLFLTENSNGFLASSRVGGLPDLSRRTVISLSPAALWSTK